MGTSLTKIIFVIQKVLISVHLEDITMKLLKLVLSYLHLIVDFMLIKNVCGVLMIISYLRGFATQSGSAQNTVISMVVMNVYKDIMWKVGSAKNKKHQLTAYKSKQTDV